MSKIQIKILEPVGFSETSLARLRQIGDVDTSGKVKADSANVQVLFIRLAHQIDKKFLEDYPSLRVIVSPTTGEEHIDKEFISLRGITLLTLKGEVAFLETVPATAEFTWGLVLTMTRKISCAYAAVLDGKWCRDQHKGNDLKGKTIALVGYGRVARLVASFAKAFNMRVKAYDPYVNEFPVGIIKCESLASLVTDADILSIHAALTPETHNLVDYDEIELLPPHALIINTARGEILNSNALLRALKMKKISGAAVDVLAEERNHGNSERHLLMEYASKNNNLIITPHLAGATFESMASTEDFMTEKLLKVLSVMSDLNSNSG